MDGVQLTEVQTALSRARTALVLNKPFLGALVLRLPMVAANPQWCPTTATDARSFYYNPNYIAALTSNQIQFVLAHEALHCALLHFARRLHRNQYRWDVACDHAINPLLVRDSLSPPPGWLVIDSFFGMTAEEIYPYIEENNLNEPMDRHVYGDTENSFPNQSSIEDKPSQPQRSDQINDGENSLDLQEKLSSNNEDLSSGAPQPSKITIAEREALTIQWQQRLVGAAQIARQSGKLSGDIARLVDQFLQPQLPWRALLARYFSATARDDYSFLRPSRREGNYILPSLHSGQLDIVVAIDVSGSIADSELQEFLSEINVIKGQVRARITLHACDEQLNKDGPWIFEPWENLILPPALHGGGGTNFVPIFEWLAKRDRAPDLLAYFTDAHGKFPEYEPEYPVLWLVKGKAPVPWGTRILLENS